MGVGGGGEAVRYAAADCSVCVLSKRGSQCKHQFDEEDEYPSYIVLVGQRKEEKLRAERGCGVWGGEWGVGGGVLGGELRGGGGEGEVSELGVVKRAGNARRMVTDCL